MFPREDTLQPIARIVKSYSTEGEVMVSFPDGMSDILKTDEPVWLFYDGLPVPFFIQTIQFKGPADYPGLSAADGHPLTEDGLTLEDLIGFTLLDQGGRTAGVISDVQDFSGNICLELEGTDTMVPYHDDLLLDINPDRRTITLRISDGLL